MNSKAQLTVEAVYEIATQLMREQRQITTLAVKKLLRKAGYKATQQDVSYLVACVAEAECWNFTFNGHHRIYTPALIPNLGQIIAEGRDQAVQSWYSISLALTVEIWTN